MKTSFFKEDEPVGGLLSKSAKQQDWVSDSCLVSFENNRNIEKKSGKTDIHYFG